MTFLPDRRPRPGAVTLARGAASTPGAGRGRDMLRASQLRAAAVTWEAASEDVGGDEAADATCVGYDGGAEVASPADEGH